MFKDSDWPGDYAAHGNELDAVAWVTFAEPGFYEIRAPNSTFARNDGSGHLVDAEQQGVLAVLEVYDLTCAEVRATKAEDTPCLPEDTPVTGAKCAAQQLDVSYGNETCAKFPSGGATGRLDDP